MSFILDALRKSEIERQRQSGPTMAEFPVAREDRHVEHAPTDQHVGKIGSSEHREHARQRARLCGVDAENARMRQGTAQRFAPGETGQCHIGGKARGAAHLLDAVEPPDRLSHDTV